MEDVPWSQRRNHGLYLSWAPHKRHKETLGSHVDAVEINITSRRNEVSSVLPFYTLKCSTTQFYMTQFWAQEALDKKAPKPPTVLTTLSCQTPNPRGCQSRVLLLNRLIDFTNSSIGDYKQTQYKQGLDTSWDNHDTCSLQNNEMLLHYTRALNPTRIPASWDDAIRNEVITEAHHSLSFCFSAWLTVRVIQSQGRNNLSETLFKHTGGNLFSVQEAPASGTDPLTNVLALPSVCLRKSTHLGSTPFWPHYTSPLLPPSTSVSVCLCVITGTYSVHVSVPSREPGYLGGAV